MAEAPTVAPAVAPTAPAPVASPAPINPPASTSTPPTEGISPSPVEPAIPPVASAEPPAAPAPSTDPFKDFAQSKTAAPPAAPAEPAVAPIEGGAEPVADWKEAMPLSLRENSYLNRFTSPEEFMKGVDNLQQLAGRKGLERPADDAPPEAWNDYWDVVGRPTNPEDYSIENLKDSTGADVFQFDQEALVELKSEFHKKGLTNDQAEFMMEKYAGIQMEAEEAKALQHQARTDETLTKMQVEHKEAADAAIQRSLNALEGVGLYDLLADAGMETDYRAIQVGLKLASEFSEAVVGPKNSVKGAETRLNEIENSKAFNSANDPQHKQAVAERNRLVQEIHGA